MPVFCFCFCGLYNELLHVSNDVSPGDIVNGCRRKEQLTAVQSLKQVCDLSADIAEKLNKCFFLAPRALFLCYS